jgi:hypothetical protein
MEVGTRCPSGLSDSSYDLALLHPAPLLHEVRLIVGIDSRPFPGVAQDDQIAIASDRISGIEDPSGAGGLDRRTGGGRDVHPLVSFSLFLLKEADTLALHRPYEIYLVRGLSLSVSFDRLLNDILDIDFDLPYLFCSRDKNALACPDLAHRRDPIQTGHFLDINAIGFTDPIEGLVPFYDVIDPFIDGSFF